MADDWEVRDEAQVVRVLRDGAVNGAFTADSSGFLGISEDRAELPAPSTDTSAPTVFALWETDYLEAFPVGGATAETPREGRLYVDIFTQRRAGRGYANKLAGELRAAFRAGNGNGVVFVAKSALTEPLGEMEGYDVVRWSCPFWGGAA